MRIVGYIENPHCKITVFQMGTKYAIKLESGLYEQTYKLRESSKISGLKDITQIVDDKFMAFVMNNFRKMQEEMAEALNRFIGQDSESEFDEII